MKAVHPPVPPPAPLAMPCQALHKAPPVRFPWPPLRVLAARLVAFGGGAALAVFGTMQMIRVFEAETLTTLQVLLTVFFALAFGWIAFAATSAVAGVLFAPRAPGSTGGRPKGLTAIVMPVYHEDPVATAAALSAMAKGLAELGAADRYEIFILSDTRDPAAWVRETAAFAALRERLAGTMAVWYRRRAENAGRKAGNVREFVERWGGRYDHMLCLDADSLMTPETILEMTLRMEADPKLGLLQTVPVLVGGETVFARLQAFAGRVYGPIVARGVAAWQGPDGNYWGHNAIVRTAAFAASAGLPTLPGRPPFGGHVLSHDFVEAALLRRAGWTVRMDPDLPGSYEGSPPSIAAAAVRDRRWAQGNLQHVRLIGAAGLRWPNRAHFAIGIGSYLASPVWLVLIAVGIVLSAQIVLGQPDYFPQAHQLFPVWPRFDAERMRWLFAGSMFLLLLPKMLGLAAALASRARSARFGGRLSVLGGAGAEIVLSALYAPIMMLIQTRQLLEILAGRDSGWSAQARAGGRLGWGEALAHHATDLIAGLVLLGAVLFAAAPLLPWLSPVLAGLILAPWLARVSGDPALGEAVARAGVMRLPEETAPHPIHAAAAGEAAAFVGAARVELVDLLRDGRASARHAAAVGPRPAAAGARTRLAEVTARAKLAAAASPEEAADWLEDAEWVALLSLPEPVAFPPRTATARQAA